MSKFIMISYTNGLTNLFSFFLNEWNCTQYQQQLIDFTSRPLKCGFAALPAERLIITLQITARA